MDAEFVPPAVLVRTAAYWANEKCVLCGYEFESGEDAVACAPLRHDTEIEITVFCFACAGMVES